MGAHKRMLVDLEERGALAREREDMARADVARAERAGDTEAWHEAMARAKYWARVQDDVARTLLALARGEEVDSV